MSLRMLAFLFEDHGRKVALIVQSSDTGPPVPPPLLELPLPGAGVDRGAGGRFLPTNTLPAGAAA
jgi:hypothetical protein